MPTVHHALPPFKFSPWLKSVIWGGNRIASFKNLDTDMEHVGESWELSAIPGKESVVCEGDDKGLTLTELILKYGAKIVGRRIALRGPSKFPILIKLIDARDKLSLQVHPDNDLAHACHNCPGKTEMWYVIKNDPKAIIMAGLEKPFKAREYETLVRSGRILDYVKVHNSSPGEIFFIPPGCIHAIGAGNFLIEIQQASDITYRVYDYGRLDNEGHPRALHIKEARRALDFSLSPDDVKRKPIELNENVVSLVSCDYFSVKRIDVDGELNFDLSKLDSFVSLTAIDGSVDVTTNGCGPVTINCGETAMIAACTEDLKLSGKGSVVTATA